MTLDRRLIGATVSFLLGVTAFVSIETYHPGDLRTTILLAAAGWAAVIGPLVLLARLMARSPVVVSIAWTIPCGIMAGYLYSVALWIYVGEGWGPPCVGGSVTMGTIVGTVCSVTWRLPDFRDSGSEASGESANTG